MTAPALYSETLGSPYMLISDGFLVKKGGVFISNAEASEAKKTHTLVDLYFDKMRRGESYDWDTARDKGALKKTHGEEKESAPEKEEASPAPVPESAPDAPPEQDSAEEPPELEETPGAETGKRSAPLGRRIIPAVLVAVGAGAMTISAVLSRKVQAVNAGPVTGTLLALVMVAFESVAFTVAAMYWRRKRIPMAVLFLCMFCVVEFYSMTNTVQVFYASYEQTLADNGRDYSSAEAVQAEAADMDAQIASKKNQIKIQEANIEYYRSREWGIRTLTDGLDRMNRELSALTEKKAEFMEAHREYAGSGAKKKETFFERVSKVTGVSDETLSMLLSCFPALFIDLIAPFSMAAAEGISDEDKEEKND